jgi:hypothetical protein
MTIEELAAALGACTTQAEIEALVEPLATLLLEVPVEDFVSTIERLMAVADKDKLKTLNLVAVKSPTFLQALARGQSKAVPRTPEDTGAVDQSIILRRLSEQTVMFERPLYKAYCATRRREQLSVPDEDAFYKVLQVMVVAGTLTQVALAVPFPDDPLKWEWERMFAVKNRGLKVLVEDADRFTEKL